MAYATLMVYVDGEDRQERTIRMSADLADRFTAKLIGVSALPLRMPIIANGIAIDVITQTEIEAMAERLSSNEEWFRQIATSSDRVIDWRCEIDSPTDFFVAQARAADLLIVNSSRGLGASNSLDVGSTILRSGRPTLIAPPHIDRLSARNVIIGWKDTREARRALGDALPFLHEADHITVAEVVSDEGREEAAHKCINDIVAYLARHRINADPRVIAQRERSTADHLLRLAKQEGADLLVTGAYGHSRLGEWVLGGVTHDLLRGSPICCLMSH
jgi:nucleotide-binding universal stress UspA family protein